MCKSTVISEEKLKKISILEHKYQHKCFQSVDRVKQYKNAASYTIRIPYCYTSEITTLRNT